MIDDFYYTNFEKIITWRKNYYHIMANSKEEADAEMVKRFKDDELYIGMENPNDELLTPRWSDCGDYYEGDECVISYSENNQRPTQELYDDAGNILEDNTPLIIKRNSKLEKILLNGIDDIPDFM